MNRSNRRTFLSPRLLAVGFSILAIILIVAGALYFKGEERKIRAEKYDDIASVSNLKIREVERWRLERLADARELARGPQIRMSLLEYLKHSRVSSTQGQILGRLELEKNLALYSDAFFVDTLGRTLISTAPKTSFLYPSELKTLRKALRGPEPVLGDFFTASDGRTYVDAMASVFGTEGRPVAVVVLRSASDNFLAPLIDTWPIPHQSAHTILVERRGDDVVVLSKSVSRTGRPTDRMIISLSDSTVAAVQAVLGKEGIFDGKDFRGMNVLADLHPLPGTPWFMVAELNAGEITSELYYRGWVVTLFVALFVALSAGFVGYVYQWRKSSVYRDLLEAEEGKRASETKYKMLFEHLTYGFNLCEVITDSNNDPIDFRFIESNAYAKEVMGLDAARVVGKTIREVMPDADPKMIETFGRVALTGKPETIEYESATFGKYLRVSVYSPRYRQFAGLFDDISDRKNAEKALRESEERFRSVYENSTIGIYRTTPDGQILLANPTLVKMLGYSSFEELAERNLQHEGFEPSYERKAFLEEIETKGEIKGLETIWVRKDGASLFVRESARGIRDSNGKILYYDGTVEDMTQRKEMEAVVRETEQKYRELVESMPVGYYKSTHEGKFVETNPAFCRMLGYSREELMSIDIPSSLYFDESDREVDNENLDFKQSTDVYRLKKKDGSEIWVEDYGRYLRDKKGSVTFHEGLCVDVTEMKLNADLERYRAEAERVLSELSRLLLGSEHEVKKIVELAVRRSAEVMGDTASVFLFHPGNSDLELAAVYSRDAEATQAFRSHFSEYPMRFDEGYYGEVISSNQARLVQTVDTVEVFATIHDARKSFYNNYPVYTAMFAPLRDGGVCIGVMGIVRRGEGGQKYTERELLFFQEVADRVAIAISDARAYETLRREVEEHRLAEERLHLQSVALNTAANGIVITDSEGHIVWANRAFETVTGYSVGEVVGKNPRELIKSGRQDREFYKEMWDRITSGEVWEGEIVNRRKDGTLYDEYMTIAPVRDDSGKISHFVAVKQDMTERKLLEEKLLQSQKLESIGQLAGGVAHDYNNILGVVIGYAELLKSRTEGNTRFEKPVDSILSAAKRGADLARQLLAFARKEMTSPKVVSINSAVESIEKMLRRLIGENIVLEFRPGERVWNVRIDPTQLDQVLVNLAANSRDAIKGAGTITIETENVTVGEAEAEERPGLSPGEFVKISFSDSGTGMDEVTQKRIFEPFFTTKERGQGTGLGLSTVYGIVKQNNGNIYVASRPGKGTIFEIFLPRSFDKAEAALQAEDDELLTGSQTVLVVEDQPEMLELTKASLEKYGYKVLMAPGPTEALLLCEAFGDTIHLLLTDVIMPVMSGKELSEKVRHLFPDMKTLFMSGYTANEIDPEGVRIANSGFIQKPFSPSQLARVVHDILKS